MTSNEPSLRQHHQQTLKLVSKSFYNELINYGVNQAEVLSVAGHLLDNLAEDGGSAKRQPEYYNRLLSIKAIQDEWDQAKRLTLKDISIRPLALALMPQIVNWLARTDIRESFYPRFPESPEDLLRYFQAPDREYFSIHYQQELVGIIGGENIDPDAGKLE